MCSLPYLLKVHNEKDIPGKPYLFADDRAVPRSMMEAGDGTMKVGIVWAGNPDHGLDHLRSTWLKFFKVFTEIPNVKLFSLQKDTYPNRKWRQEMVALNEDTQGMPVTNLSAYLKNFSDTAAVINKLDLVVTIDSARGPLSGCNGSPGVDVYPDHPRLEMAARQDRLPLVSEHEDLPSGSPPPVEAGLREDA